MPVDEAYLVRRIEDLERKVRELGPSVAQSFVSTVAALVQFGSIGLSTVAFDVPTTDSDSNVAAGTIAVPPGYTRAAILGIVSVGAWNGTTAGGYIYVRAYINGVGGAQLIGQADSGHYVSVGASAIRTLSGLDSDTPIRVGVSCNAGGGWGANGTNIANIDAIALFGK